MNTQLNSDIPRCEHEDVRVHRHEPTRRAIACFACGRLFGWLADDKDETVIAYNPAQRYG